MVFQFQQFQQQEKKQCFFCTSNMKNVDYKDSELLRKFLNPQGKIGSRRRSGSCSTHQRKVARALKRARFLALVPFTTR